MRVVHVIFIKSTDTKVSFIVTQMAGGWRWGILINFYFSVLIPFYYQVRKTPYNKYIVGKTLTFQKNFLQDKILDSGDKTDIIDCEGNDMKKIHKKVSKLFITHG